MPLYEFKCPECGFKKERLQKYADAPPECPHCHVPTQRCVSAGSFELKGTGWYRDHYGLKTE